MISYCKRNFQKPLFIKALIDGIANVFDHSYINSFAEGGNNKIKVLKHSGLKNSRRFRNRILHIFA